MATAAGTATAATRRRGGSAGLAAHHTGATRNDTPNRNACVRVVREGFFGHALSHLEALGLLNFVLWNGFVNVCGHGFDL